MTTQATSLTLNAGWTEMQPTLTNSSNVNVFSNNAGGYYWSGYWYPYYQPWYGESHFHYHYRDVPPIKLTMVEVERLRVAAKKDKELKATLEKFTDHIEVIVDFGKAA